MNTKIIVTILVVAVLAGGYAMYKGKSTPASVDNTELAGGTQPAGKKMAFSELIKQGGSYQCTVKQYVGETETMGTVLLHKDHVRAEFNSSVQGMNIGTTMIVRDGYTYTWTSAMPNKGFKSKAVEVVGGDAVVGTPSAYSFNATQIGDYDCQDWTADESKFIPPSSVIFTEVK